MALLVPPKLSPLLHTYVVAYARMLEFSFEKDDPTTNEVMQQFGSEPVVMKRVFALNQSGKRHKNLSSAFRRMQLPGIQRGRHSQANETQNVTVQWSDQQAAKVFAHVMPAMCATCK